MKISSISTFTFLSLLTTATRADFSKSIVSPAKRQLKKAKAKSSKKKKNPKSDDDDGGLTMGKEHPNIVIIMTDEQRFPTFDDKAKLGEDWFETYLPGQAAMKKKSTQLINHYIGSTACTPSRALIFTGQYPTLNGVAYTPGAAKLEHENDMFHLDFNTVPTLGDYFTEAGYRSYYRGKWHIGHADLEVPINRSVLASSNKYGEVIPKNTDLYLKAQRLSEYGFKDNVGPDAHGSAESNAGVNRDPLIADQAVRSLDMLEESDDETPFLLVASFLNPHDIVLFGALWASWGRNYTEATEIVPDYGEPTTRNENLTATHKPKCQADYVDKYGAIFLPQIQVPVYYKFYFWLMHYVDAQIKKVWDRLQNSRFKDNTVVFFTSDHGEALGSHGGMHQKWHQAYEETTHVNFMVSGPGVPEGEQIDILSSHIDIVPTLLGFANLDEPELCKKLKEVHSEAQSLPGRNLKDVIKGTDTEDRPVYFMTEDDISVGTNQVSIAGVSYDSVIDPSKVEAVIHRIDGKIWKYVRTYNNSFINPPEPGTPDSEEFELYNVSDDPVELFNVGWDNVGTTDEARVVMPIMQTLLEETRDEKLRKPENLVVAS